MRLTAREPTEVEFKEAMANKPVYKVVRVKGKKLKSLWVDGTKKKPMLIEHDIVAFALTYAEGKLSDNGRYGIWCCKTLAKAVLQSHTNGRGKRTAIFKAYPIGEPIQPPLGWGWDAVLYPAIILGERVVE